MEYSNAMSLVKRYHVLVRRAYKIIKEESPSIKSDECLQMAVKSTNDSIGPEHLVPAILVYYCLPRLGLLLDRLSPSAFEQAAALKYATNAMSNYLPKSQIFTELRTRNEPGVTGIRSAPLGSKVLVYRRKIDGCIVPFNFLEIDRGWYGAPWFSFRSYKFLY